MERKKKFTAYVIVKSRKCEKRQYLQTIQSFVDDIHDAKFYEKLEDAEKDRNIASYNYDLYMWMLHEPKYNFEIISV